MMKNKFKTSRGYLLVEVLAATMVVVVVVIPLLSLEMAAAQLQETLTIERENRHVAEAQSLELIRNLAFGNFSDFKATAQKLLEVARENPDRQVIPISRQIVAVTAKLGEKKIF